jgi:hypothetical protein
MTKPYFWLWRAVSSTSVACKTRRYAQTSPQYNSGQMLRILRRLRAHGLIEKGSHCYKYYLTVFGKEVVTLGLKLKNLSSFLNLRQTQSEFLPIPARI